MKRAIALILALMMVAMLCGCGKKTETETQTADTSAATVEQAAQAVAEEQNEAGVVFGTVSHLSTSRMLVVEANGNVYCFDIPIDTDTTNMFAENTVSVSFTGTLDPSIGTSFQNVTVTKIEFSQPAEVVQVETEAQESASEEDVAATTTAEGNAIMYIWSDGTTHTEPEEGQTAIKASQVATIQFEEPQLTGQVNSCNGTIIGLVEDGKYLVLDDGASHQFMFYIEGKPQKSYDGTGIEIGANCSVLYVGTLNPNYGSSMPQWVTVQDVQTDSKAYYYSVIAPKTTTNVNPTPGPNGMWYGSDGKLHWYGSDGKVYNYDSKGNIVLS